MEIQKTLFKTTEIIINSTDKLSDREVQFWESKECESIKSECSKEQVLEWVKNNPNYDFKVMYDTLGVGCFKFEAELKEEGLI